MLLFTTVCNRPLATFGEGSFGSRVCKNAGTVLKSALVREIRQHLANQ